MRVFLIFLIASCEIFAPNIASAGSGKGHYSSYETAPYRRPARPSPPRSLSNPSGSYRNCAAARAAGVAPLRRGEAGYGRHLDADGDGVACEPYRGR